jgi:hypothetical protein
MHKKVIEAENQIIKLFNINFKNIEMSGRYIALDCEMNKLEEILEDLYFQAQRDVRE